LPTYPLSLHDALPISLLSGPRWLCIWSICSRDFRVWSGPRLLKKPAKPHIDYRPHSQLTSSNWLLSIAHTNRSSRRGFIVVPGRSEEHTSELQSRSDL